MKMKLILLPLLLLGIVINVFSQELAYPKAPKDTTIIDHYFDLAVPDPYRSLEDGNLESTKQWIQEENKLTEKYINNLESKSIIGIQVQMISRWHSDVRVKKGNHYFDYWKNANYPSSKSLYYKKHLYGTMELLVDPFDYKKSKQDLMDIIGYEVSADNKYIAFEITTNGSDWKEIHVSKLSSGKRLKDELKWVKFSNIIWKGNGFYYVRYPEPEAGKAYIEKNQFPSIYYHVVGTNQEEDKLLYSSTSISGLSLDLKMVGDEEYMTITPHMGAPLIKNLNDSLPPRLITELHVAKKYNVVEMYMGKLLTIVWENGSNGRMVLIDPKGIEPIQPFIDSFKANTNYVLQEACVVGNKVVGVYIADGEYVTIIFDRGIPIKKLRYPLGASISGFSSNIKGTTTLFNYYSFLYPPIAYELDVESQNANLLGQTQIYYDYQDFVTQKVYYYSKDSTTIPMLLAYKKDMVLNSNNPSILYGYGGFGISTTPFFNPYFIYFIQNGGVIALPYIRGGGEKGNEWHNAGSRLNKQNSFDDFAAAAEYLKKEGYTKTEKLAIMGSSNGGLLVGTTITQHPNICKAAIADVGAFDMMRFDKYTIGAAWDTEYGSTHTKIGSNNLYQYSPYHHVNAGVSYPATLLITSDHDDRVVPMHTYKFGAMLQKKNSSKNPILIYTNKNEGHSSRNNATNNLRYAFIFQNLGMTAQNINYWF